MNLSEPFIQRPIATTLLTVGVVLAGVVGFVGLPVAPLPQVDFPTISVQASLPGASAAIMASSVASPLERQLGQIADVSEMTSASSLGSTSVTLQFNLDRDINSAAHDVQAAINASRSYLPANLPANPSYREVNPADAPILILGLTSRKYSTGTLYDEASTIMEQKLSQIAGVGEVVVGGGASPAVRVEVNPTELNAYGLTLSDVRSVLSLQNSDMPLGQISGPLARADIVANDQISTAAAFQPLIVGYHNGAGVRLADVAQVTDSVQNIRTAGYLNGTPSVTVIVFRQPGANIIQTIAAVRAQLPFLQSAMPQGISTTVVLDRTTTIRASVSDVEHTLVYSVLLVMLVVFLFLRSPRASLVPCVAIPVSLIGTFAVMYLLGYTLDNLSLMALTVATGFVVDDAIVVMENITRHIEGGMAALPAALLGAREIGFTVISMSTSLIAVFIPILMMGGIIGRLFREFAVTLATAIGVSMLVSLTTTPTMCAHLLRSTGEHGRAYLLGERAFNAMLDFYRRTLASVLRHAAWTLAVLLLTIAANLWLIVRIPKGFFPEQDTGAISGAVRGPESASFPVMNTALRRIVAVVKADPAVANVNAYTGGNGGTNTGFLYIALKALPQRDNVSATEVIARLRPRLAAVPGASAFLQSVQDVRVGGRSSNAQYQYTLQANDLPTLAHWGPILLAAIQKLPGFQDVSSDQQNGGLDQVLTYDRVTAARAGLTASSLDSSLYAAFGQSEVSVIYNPLNQYYVVLEVAPAFSQTPAALRDVYVRGATGNTSTGAAGIIPLRVLATDQSNTTPLSINHSGLFPSVTVSFNLAPNVSLSQATAAIEQAQRRLAMPTTITGFFAGTLQAYQQSLASEPILVAAALFAVYIVLGVLYESLVHPLTILSTIPSASMGAMLALLLFKIDLNIVSIIGIVLLIGIVKKNAIMMIDFALVEERENGKNSYDAIYSACLLRFRPIMMTTLAALFGAVPLAFGTGMGSELRQPLGITIVGGLIVSQMLTLYTTPVVYLFLDRWRLHGKEPALAS